MTSDQVHPQYESESIHWKRMRDVVGGEWPVQQRALANYDQANRSSLTDTDQRSYFNYVPGLSEMTPQEYEAYLKRPAFYEATGRTVDILSGLVFRKEPKLEVPTSMLPWMDNIDLAGLSFQSLAENTIEELLTVTRGGILVDFTNTDVAETRGDERDLGARPFVRLYKAESILDWDTETVRGRTQLTFVKVLEEVSERDGVERKTIEQMRFFLLEDGQLLEEGSGLVYVIRTFRKNEEGEWFESEPPNIPKKAGGQPLDFIPFFFINSRDAKPDVAKPMLLGLANLNLAHFRISVCLANVAFWSVPQPWATGIAKVDLKNLKFTGPSRIWYSENKEAQFGLLQSDGKLDGLQQERSLLESQMAALGARVLAPEKRTAEAAETEMIRRSGENSVLASAVNNVSKTFMSVLETMAAFSGISGNITVKLNTDYMPIGMSAQKLTALMGAWQGQMIAHKDATDIMVQDELIGANRTSEDILSDIAQEAPQLGNTGNGPVDDSQ